jgi:hypothetical protein
MKAYTINGINIKSSEPEIYWNDQIDIDNGFIYVVLEFSGEKYTLQACLEERKDRKGYKKSINADDCGFSEGICSDNNDKLINAAGISTEEAFEIFLTEAKRLNVKIN